MLPFTAIAVTEIVMRYLFLPVLAFLAATPALAQRPAPADVAAALDSPIVQEGVANRVSDAVAALLDTRVGAVERAVNPFSDARRNDTLRDRISRDDPNFEARIHDDTRRATRAAGVMAGEFSAMLPELRARLANIKHRLRNLDDRGPAYRDDLPPPHRDDYDDEDWDN